MSWRDRFSLSTQFLIAAAAVLVVSMAVLGSWVTREITRSVLQTAGQSGSDFMKSFIEAEVQNLNPDGTMPLENQQWLDRFFGSASVTEGIVSVKIWRPDGVVIYANMAKEIIGQHFVSTDVEMAARGKIIAEFEDMVSAESAYEQSLNISVIEVYAPLYKAGAVVAVGEIYEDARAFDAQLASSRNLTWVVVCFTTLLMFSLLYMIVRRGSATIIRQRNELNELVADANEMAAQNRQLRLDANEANEALLGRIGSDIHDGPIQILTLARFGLDEVAGMLKDAGPASSHLDDARNALAGSIDELRDISTGLVLPELADLSPHQVIQLACDRHANMTATPVDFTASDLPLVLPEAMKVCIYRVVQESLANAFRHAGGAGQRVHAQVLDYRLELDVRDSGPGAAKAAEDNGARSKLGHTGIRNRVQVFGGSVEIAMTEHGTQVRVTLPLERSSSSASNQDKSAGVTGDIDHN